MKWFVRLTVIAALLIFSSVGTAFAEEDMGYIVKLKPTAAIPASFEDGYELDQLKYMPEFCRVETLEELETYIGMENVEYVEPRYPLTLCSQPNDIFYSQQWGYTAIKADYARLAGIDGDGIRVAVIDTGLNKEHEDFEGASIHNGENFATVSATNKTVKPDDLTDYIGHGTAVTSVILAQPDNGKGICGIAPGVTLVPMRVFSATQSSADWAAEAIYAAVDKYDCDVINMSFGLLLPSAVFTEAVEYALEKGVILVASAGNSGDDSYFYPASFDGVISVASIDSDGNWSDFSQYNDQVFVTAPGRDIALAKYNNNSGYFKDKGTSFSSPMVAALAALVLQASDGMTREEFCDLLIETSTDLGEEGYDVYYGHGLINVEKALQSVIVVPTEIKAKKDGDATEVFGHLEGREPYETIGLALASYHADGRMLSFNFLDVVADKNGVAEVRVKIQQEIAKLERVRLFWVGQGGDLIPADVPKEIELE